MTGKASQKKKKDVNGELIPRHDFSKKGIIGADIGTQSVAVVSDEKLILKNLAERNGMSTKQYEKRKTAYRRSMDRSRRATNPDNYNEDGTIKEKSERNDWNYSNTYRKKRYYLRELERKARLSRKDANRELANKIRSLGSELITEQPNFKALQKKAKESKVVIDKNGNKKNTSRKRYGKSVYHRSPGQFQNELKLKFGDGYHEVSRDYKASQYDHSTDDYIKKKLSDRIYCLTDGRSVQRDLYSAFLLKHSNSDYTTPDLNKCLENFDHFYSWQNSLLNKIINIGMKVCNSGLKKNMVFA